MKRHSDSDGLSTTSKVLLGIGAVVGVALVTGFIHEQLTPDASDAEPVASQEPKPGDILLFYRPRLGRDYFIRWVTKSPFYHAALYAGNGTVVEARPSGVHQNDLVGRENCYLVLPAPDGKGAAALAWAKTQIGDSYDKMEGFVAGLEHVFVHWHINYNPPGGKFSCAELVTAAFEHAGFKPFPGRKPQDIVPADWAEYLPAPYNKSLKQW